MWPHHCIVGVGDTAVAVGSDDPAVLERLAPWKIDEPYELVDYVVEVHPESGHLGTRPLPNLRHGTERIGTSSDAGDLVDGLLRVLGSFTVPSAADLRLDLIPVLAGDRALLLPTTLLGTVSTRLLAARGLTTVWCDSVEIDVAERTVRVAPLLGQPESAIVVPLREWWLAADGHEHPSQVMPLVTPLLTRRAAALEAGAWTSLGTLVKQCPPRLVRPERAVVRRELDAFLRR